MAYRNIEQIREDGAHWEELLDDDNDSLSDDYTRSDNRRRLSRESREEMDLEWFDRMNEKFVGAKKLPTPLGRFIRKYNLSLREVLVLMNLPSPDQSQSQPEVCFPPEGLYDIFQHFRVTYGSSMLKRYKLVFKIKDPMIPMRIGYTATYKGQLGLLGQKYTNEHMQQDKALERQTKSSSQAQIDGRYYCVTPRIKLNELVVDDLTLVQLKTALSRETNHNKIFRLWGFDEVLDYGKGTTLNFRGPPGTGKTMAAHCFAAELGRQLLIVRYDELQSKWTGECEKNIHAAFKTAKTKNAVLFFDEADAIALTRDNLDQSWEMSQVNTLLKELERFEGVCIFATNYAEKYDKAFERRLTMHIDFRLPNKTQARKILEYVLPKKARDKTLTLDSFSLEGFSGGDLKNIALNAAGVAARENSPKIMTLHVAEAIAMARKVKETEWNRWYMG